VGGQPGNRKFQKHVQLLGTASNYNHFARRSRQFSYENYLQKWTPQFSGNLHHGHNQIKTIFIMGVRGSRIGYGNPKRISFLSGFTFPHRLEPCGPRQLNVMAICARQE